MISKTLLATAAMAGALALVGQAARADPVNATLTAHYFEVADHSDPDFNVNTTPTVLAGSHLGPDGLPVGTGVNDLSGGQITWWSPALNTHVIMTSTGTISLPYDSEMFPPNSTGSSNSAFFETAFFTGSFNLASSSTVAFTLGSDDDSFIYVDGTLFGQNPGVHGVSTVTFTSPTLNAGAHDIEVFYADRQNVEAHLSLNLVSTNVTITPGVPEPATWAMMLLGFGGLGAMLRRRRAVRGAVTA